MLQRFLIALCRIGLAEGGDLDRARNVFSQLGPTRQLLRIERFFGTLKASLNQWAVENREQLRQSLALFRDWYCTVRPHANLDGRTPYEAWHGIDPYRNRPKHIEWFEAWDGLLTGIRIRYR